MSKKRTATAEREEYLTILCPFCDKKHGAYMSHYQILRAGCGRFFWALREQRNGPLKLFVHPGFFPKAA